ncbi:TauD/TfdA dioxygenase family protein [Candidatus Poriferisodalis sp.]|uniref:TauD/TfdA dioxygenase family protein n=1 Tax=Candidatus Poriferisodalis sp. TaxID=3101277 RepID=UPI003AF484A1
MSTTAAPGSTAVSEQPISRQPKSEQPGAGLLDVRPLAGALGAELWAAGGGALNVNALDDEHIASIREALCACHVVVIRDQHMEASDVARFGRRFGELERHPYLGGTSDEPEVVPVIKEPHETVNFGGGWHSEMSFLECPPMATALYAVEVPSFGGDTLFANQQAAYIGMSDTMKGFAESLSAVHSAARQYGRGGEGDRYSGRRSAMTVNVSDDAHEQLTHPVVRTHPETGAKALYVNRAFTEAISGMRRHESKALLEMLWSHAVDEQFTCRVRWEPGTLTMWDNRSVQHYALNDYHGQRRHMLRVTIAGDRPR